MEKKTGQRIAVFLILIGLLVLSAYIGWRQLGWLFSLGTSGSREQSEEQAPQEQTVEEPFDEICVEVDVGEIVLQRGKRYRCETFWSGADYAMETTVEDGKLTVVSRVQGKLHLNVQGNDGQVKITVPEDAVLGDVTLSSGIGSITVDGADGLEMSELDIQTDLGGVEIKDMRCETLDCTSGMEEIRLERLTAEDISCTADMGDISALKVNSQEVELHADMGNIFLKTQDKESACKYDLKTDLGEVIVNGQSRGTKTTGGSGSRSLNMTTNMGDIELEFQ